MQIINNEKIKFINEQDGEVERLFKSTISLFLNKNSYKIRAYLIRVIYPNRENEFDVALGISNDADHDVLLDQVTKIFKEIFGANEHLNILFFDRKTEIKARKISCPFYISHDNQFDIPDFCLSSSESYNLESVRSCFKRKKLLGSNKDGYILCDIFPVISNRESLQDSGGISNVILASRHKNYSLFQISSWPAYVHIARPLINNIENKFYISDSDIELIGWGELYKNKNEK